MTKFYMVYCSIDGKKTKVICEKMVECDFIEGFVRCEGVKFLKDTSFDECEITEISFPKEDITHYSVVTITGIDISNVKKDSGVH